MKRYSFLLALVLASACSLTARADDETMPTPDNGEPTVVETAPVSDEQLVSAELLPFDRVVPEASKLGGPLTTYRKKDNIYWELDSGAYNADWIVIISIARGIGESELYGGQSIDYGDDMIWRFKKVDDRIQIIRRNFRYKSDKGPDAEALRVAFTDSIIFSLPIVAKGPNGGDVVDITGLFMSDSLARISSRIGGSFARDRSTWEKVKALKDNLELEVAATYSAGYGETDTIIDTRGISVNVHYSISQLKDTGYQPRYADERVGYFMTALRDISKINDDDNFIRYINRRNLQKLEPNAEVSLPKKPIVYWLDKATPYKYRKTVRDAVLEWNKAFEKAGFYNAIEVRQQEENDEWDAEDINYNTIRWSATQTGFAIGPSRVNPMTGEILDADIVFSTGFFSSWTRQFELYTSDQLVEKFRAPRTFGDSKEQHDFDYAVSHCACSIDKELFYAQQFGLANTFFDIMSVNDPDYAPIDEPVAIEDEPSQEQSAEAKAEEEAKAVAKAAEQAAEEESAKMIAAKAAEAAAKAAEAAQKAAEEAGKAADNAELAKKVEEAKEAAEVAKRVADETAKKLAEVQAQIAKEKEEAAAKAAEEAKKAEEAAKAKEEEAKKAKEKADADKAREENKKRLEKEREKMIEQGLRQTITHEVGHTLGLRHNFIQSTLHTLDEINDASKWQEHGFVGSVMEYAPVNIMPKGRQQGDYYSFRLGEYDEWAIEYGYRSFGKSTDAEREDLKKIAAKQSLPQYKFSTDEDCYGSTVNPYVNIWDLGASPLEYAKVRAQLIDQLLPGLDGHIVKDGESYNRLRARFNMLCNWKVSGMVFAANYVGGIKVNRDFKGDENGKKPFEIIPAQDQRDAMAFLAQECFGVDSFKVPTELYNYLAPNRWNHWGSSIPNRYDYDVHSNLLSWKRTILSQLLSSRTLTRLADDELRADEGADVYTSAEMIETLTNAIFKEILDGANAAKGEGKATVTISSQRRALQRLYLSYLLDFATGESTAAGTADVEALARMQLRSFLNTLNAILDAPADKVEFKSGNGKTDSFGRAHLEEMREQVKKTIDAVKTLGGSSYGSSSFIISL